MTSRKFLGLELRETLIGTAVFVALQLIIIFSSGFRHLWVLPTEDFGGLLGFHWWGHGVLIGFLHMGWDDLMGSREYFIHRGVSRSTLYRTRLIPGLLAIGILMLLPMAVHITYGHLADSDASAMRWSLVPQAIALSTACFSGFCVGAFAAGWNGGLVERGLVAAAGISGIRAISAVLDAPVGDAWSGSPVVYATAQVSLGILLLWGGRPGFLEGHERDLPLEPKRALRQSLVASILVLTALGGVARNWQASIQRGAAGAYPTVGMLDDGSFGLFQYHADQRGGVLVDEIGAYLTEDGFPTEEPIAVNHRSLFVPWFRWTRSDDTPWESSRQDEDRFDDAEVPFGAPWAAVDVRSDDRAYFSHTDGGMHVFQFETPQRRKDSLHVFIDKGPNLGRFSPDSLLLGDLDKTVERGETLIYDPSDQTFWRWQRALPLELQALDAPLEAEFSRNFDETDEGLALQFEDTWLQYGDGEFRPIPEGSEPPKSDFQGAPGAVDEVAEGLRIETLGPAEYRLRFVDPETGEARFEHEYTFASVGRRDKAVWMKSLALLRAPVLSTWSFFRDLPNSDPIPRDSDSTRWIDSTFFGGNNLVWLLSAWLLTLCCAVHRGAILQRAGIEGSRTVLEPLLVLLLGPCAYITLDAMEGRFALRSIEARRAIEEPPIELPMVLKTPRRARTAG